MNNQLLQTLLPDNMGRAPSWLTRIGVLLLVMVVTGCVSDKVENMKIPGNPKLNDYAIRFEIDWNVFESGTYIYNPADELKDLPHQMGGGRSGYWLFYTLILDFRFKDGREFHEEIDLEPLIHEMLKKNTIPDLSKSKWGGFATINIRLESDRLTMDYELSEMIHKGNPIRYLSKRSFFPIFEKMLD